jgi:plasmid stabilization system protein ParE
MGPRRRRVVWTRGASQELDENVEFIAEDSLQAAIDVLQRVLKAAESLADLSDRGRIVPERGDPTIREILIEPFRLLYSITEEEVTILGILHQRRDFASWDRPGR